MTTKFEVKKFIDSNDFGLWKVNMKVVSVKESLAVALDGEDKLPNKMRAEENKDLMDKAI